MAATFVRAFSAEWLKKKRSLATWIVLIGGFFTPAIITVVRVIYSSDLARTYMAPNFWLRLWDNSWESMAIFLMPVGVILASSLITQIEYRNNSWKQLHATPLPYTSIFFSKLLVIVVMMFQFFVLFNIGIYLSALIPYLLVKGVSYPYAPIPAVYFIKENMFYFMDCLPIIGVQYLISLQYRNFLVPVGLGIAGWIASIAALSWKYAYLVPYTYCMFNYLKDHKGGRAATPPVNIHVWALAYFAAFVLLGYILYIGKKEKG